MNTFVTKRQIAELFGVSARTVEHWVESGRLAPPIKFGSAAQARVRWPAEAVAQLEADLRGAVKSTATPPTPAVKKPAAPTRGKKKSARHGRLSAAARNDALSVA
jgi:hypothetical protein